MQAIIAIALLCQVSSNRLLTSLDEVERHQVKCQKELLDCYSKNYNPTPKTDVWDGALKNCAMERANRLAK